jgi:hypothetical protein
LIKIQWKRKIKFPKWKLRCLEKRKKKLKAHEKCIFFQEFFLHSQEAFPKTEKKWIYFELFMRIFRAKRWKKIKCLLSNFFIVLLEKFNILRSFGNRQDFELLGRWWMFGSSIWNPWEITRFTLQDTRTNDAKIQSDKLQISTTRNPTRSIFSTIARSQHFITIYFIPFLMR